MEYAELRREARKYKELYLETIKKLHPEESIGESELL